MIGFLFGNSTNQNQTWIRTSVNTSKYYVRICCSEMYWENIVVIVVNIKFSLFYYILFLFWIKQPYSTIWYYHYKMSTQDVSGINETWLGISTLGIFGKIHCHFNYIWEKCFPVYLWNVFSCKSTQYLFIPLLTKKKLTARFIIWKSSQKKLSVFCLSVFNDFLLWLWEWVRISTLGSILINPCEF